MLSLVGLLTGFSSAKRSTQTYSSLNISIDQPTNSRFVTQENIANTFSTMGYGLANQNINNIDLARLEQNLKNKPSIAKANVYRTIGGRVEIEIEEREPIVRIFNDNGISFYLDGGGSLMPLSNQYSARVMIVNGNVNIPYSTVNQLEDLENKISKMFRRSNTSAVQNTELINKLRLDQQTLPGADLLKGVFELAKFIHTNDFWKAQISQVHIQDENNIELIPRVGNHVILLGDASQIEEKFQKLFTFYQQGLSKTGWNEYSVINLKFKNQVVCTKR